MNILKRAWIILKIIIAALTVLTILVLFLQALPEIMQWAIVRGYPYLPFIFIIVVSFWCGYLVKWIKIG